MISAALRACVPVSKETGHAGTQHFACLRHTRAHTGTQARGLDQQEHRPVLCSSLRALTSHSRRASQARKNRSGNTKDTP